MNNENSVEDLKESREKEIVKVSIITIIVNLLLSAFKGAVGFISNSVAIQADAINSLSDALAAIVTIIGIKLSGKDPNEKHPLGYGRYEYLSDGIVAFLVIYAGITTFVDSIKKIISPGKVEYDSITLAVLVVAVIVKIALGMHEQKVGEKNNSNALKAAGVDSISDSIVTSVVFVSAILHMMFKINVEAYLGLIISVMIIKSGFEMFRETIDEILGNRIQGELINAIKDTLSDNESVYGAFDLVLHAYGPERYIGSVHIEVPSTLTMEELDFLERKLTADVYRKHGVFLSGIGVYSVNVVDEDVIALRNRVTEIAVSYEHVMQLHGFVVNMKEKELRFDLVIDFMSENSDLLIKKIKEHVKSEYPDFEVSIQKDINVDL